jgi:hypothetical protein
MATYKEIKGTSIEVVSSDPSNPQLGQIWYNTTSQTLKGEEFGAAAWSAGGNLGTARYYLTGEDAGTQTAGLAFGGSPGSSPFMTNSTEEYNGSSWTAGGNLGTTRYCFTRISWHYKQLGLVLVVMFKEVEIKLYTEEYDGSSWTSGGNLTSAREKL